MSRHLRSRVSRLGATLVAAALLLAGCAIPVPTVEPDAAPEGPQPALDEARLDRVLDAVAEAVAAGDEASDPEQFGTRVDGPAFQTREAEYRLAEATADTDEATSPQPLPTEPQVVVMGNADTWPKTIFVFTTIAEGMNTPLLLGLQQADPRADYELVGWVRLLPEVTTPATAIPAEGSPQVAADAEGLVLSPAETVRAYADVLQNGDESENADTFAADIFRTFVAEDREAISESVEDAGTYSETFEIARWTPLSLQTADGGAIVIGALRSQQTYERTIEDSEMTVGGQIALMGGSESIDVESSLTATYFLTVAFYVPPESEDGTIQVLGAERVLEDVTTD